MTAMRIPWLKPLLIFLALITISLSIGLLPVQANTKVVDIYFYHSKTCPHCLKQKPLMESIAKKNPQVKLHSYEVQENPRAWHDFLRQYQLPNGAVPRTRIGDKIFVGYTEESGPLEYIPTHNSYLGYRNQIIKAIETLTGKQLILTALPAHRPAQAPWPLFLGMLLYSATYPLLHGKSAHTRRYWWLGWAFTLLLTLFSFLALTPETLIKQFAESLPFPLFVSTLALADGFNPCAFTVLIILLSLLTYTKSRRDMTLVGATFITTSGVMYFLFILALLAIGSIFLERWGTLLLTILGGLITLAGLINLKDYFWFKQGFSLTLSEEQQRTISQKASQISRHLREASQDERFFWVGLAGTATLAIFVNLIELGCTAILPVVYLTALVQYCRTNFWLCAIFWTMLYALLYILPLVAILANFIYFFKSSRLSEGQGRILKFVSGIFMIFFGVIMMVRPEALSFG
jgi:thiol-disulfide isomerase/thioredoxin